MITNQLQKNIMRRVYYAFAIRLATHATTLHLLVLAAGVYALGYFVHVAAVMQNLSRVPMGEFGPHMLRVVMQADVITLVVLGVVVMTALSLPFSLPQYQRAARTQIA